MEIFSSLDLSIGQSIGQSINQSITQSIGESQSVCCANSENNGCQNTTQYESGSVNECAVGSKVSNADNENLEQVANIELTDIEIVSKKPTKKKPTKKSGGS